MNKETNTKQYEKLMDLLNDLDPEFAKEFRKHQNHPWRKLQHWYYKYWVIPRMVKKQPKIQHKEPTETE